MSSTEPRPAWRGRQGIVHAETELEPFTAKRFLTFKAFIGFAGLGLVCLVGIAMVVFERWTLKGTFMALLIAAVVMFFISVFAGAHAISNGKVYFAAEPPLTFLPNHRYLGFLSLAALLAIGVGVVGVLTHVMPGVEPVSGWGARGGLNASRATVRASLYTFGTAPDVIVQTIRYYKDHPNQRFLLSDPWPSLKAAAKKETNST